MVLQINHLVTQVRQPEPADEVEEEADEEDMAAAETYADYKPAKCNYSAL